MNDSAFRGQIIDGLAQQREWLSARKELHAASPNSRDSDYFSDGDSAYDEAARTYHKACTLFGIASTG
jgi:hypothetical protein